MQCWVHGVGLEGHGLGFRLGLRALCTLNPKP